MEKKNQQEKLSYEKLQEVANGLLQKSNYYEQQCKQMAAKIKELSEFAAFKRLDYLFKVVEMSDKFPSDFVVTCNEEIVATMTIPEKTEEPEVTEPETKEE